MKIQVTLDFVDGSKSKTADLWQDEFNTQWLLMRLSEPGVAGITITRKDVLNKYLRAEAAKKETEGGEPR